MNQSILFPDIQHWDSEKQWITFPAQAGGALIECVVTKTMLSRLSGDDIHNEQDALAVFGRFRFDIEELAESLIADEQFNDDGSVDVVG